MKHITSLGIDISKKLFELCGLDKQGNKIYGKTVKRNDFVKTVQMNNGCIYYYSAERVAFHRGRNRKLPGGVTQTVTRFLGSKVDVWALGLTLFELACNHFPFKETVFNEMLLL